MYLSDWKEESVDRKLGWGNEEFFKIQWFLELSKRGKRMEGGKRKI